jgi:hypothetical protein
VIGVPDVVVVEGAVVVVDDVAVVTVLLVLLWPRVGLATAFFVVEGRAAATEVGVRALAWVPRACA